MAFSLNKVQLIGCLGKDQETRFTNSGTGVSSFSIATTHSYKDKSDQWQNETTWHNITAWSLSDYMKDQLKKGKKIYVEGRISIDEYTDKDGVERKAFKIIAEKIIPLESNGNGSSNRNEDVYDKPGPSSKPDDNDDLPF